MRRSKKDSELSSLIYCWQMLAVFLPPKIPHINYTTKMDDGCRLGWPLKNLYASREELQKELEKKERK